MAVQYKDYYEILGVPRTASQEDIRKAYRKLAKKYHPDVSKEKNADVRYREINEAYEVLKDPDKRVKYDTLGANWEQGQDFTPPPGWGSSMNGGPQVEFGGDLGDFSDFFRTIFGGGGLGDMFAGGKGPTVSGRSRPIQRDSEVELTLSLEDVIQGGTKALPLRLSSGSEAQTINVNLPRGVVEGSRIRLPGKSPRGGDIYVTLHIAPDPVFEVDGHNLTRTVKVTPAMAVLGGRVNVETPSGVVEMKLPPGIQGGQKLRLRGKGLPRREKSSNGDLFVRIEIAIPKYLTERQKELWEELAKLDNK
ncbi:MAG: DnaJ domain-containing protein [Synergistaceae bacterium]|jgi:curved DNA-binding protein|nr:DnaJ domain-containing protein [Synergistaceae bacterium]